MIAGIGHLAFTVSNMEKALQFYCKALGFQKVFALDHDSGEPWIVYLKVCDGQFVELFYGGISAPPRRLDAAGYSHLCLVVDDIQNVVEQMKVHNIALDVEPQQGKDYNYQCWVRDPDGNRIEFMQLHPDSPQANA